MSEPTNPTTGADLDVGLQPMIEIEGIAANAEYLVWDNIAMHRSAIATQGGNAATFPKLSALAPTTTALDATENPSAESLADTAVTITPNEYGVPVELGRKLLRTSPRAILQDAIRILSVNAVESRDKLGGTVALAGSNVRYVNGRANAGLLQAGDVVSRAEIVRAKVQLGKQKAPKFADGSYAAVLGSAQIGDVFGSGSLNDFVDVSKYASPEVIRTGEIGRFMGFTFYEASQANVSTGGAGAGLDPDPDADLCLALFCGMGYLGYAYTQDPMVIPAFDANDRLKRFISLGWYGDYNYGRIREENGYRLGSRSAYSTTP